MRLEYENEQIMIITRYNYEHMRISRDNFQNSMAPGHFYASEQWIDIHIQYVLQYGKRFCCLIVTLNEL